MEDTKKAKKRVLIFAISLIIYGFLATNIYLPIVPHLTNLLNTTQNAVKFSIVAFFFGYAISQLLWGPLSDRYGRKIILIIALTLSLVGTFLSASAINISMFTTGRFIEGFGVGCGPVISRIMLADLLEATSLQVAMTYVVSASCLLPAIAPVIGGFIYEFAGWRFIFIVLGILGILLIINIMLKLMETIQEKTKHFSVKHIAKGYVATLKSPVFVGYLLSYALIGGGLISFYALSPYIFVSQLGMKSSTYGFLLIILGVLYIAGTTTNRKLAYRVSQSTLIIIGYILSAICFISYFVLYKIMPMTILNVVIPAAFYSMGTGFISPCMNSAAIKLIEGKVGYAAGILGIAVPLASTIIMSAVATVNFNSLLMIGTYFAVLVILSFLFYLMVLLTPKK